MRAFLASCGCDGHVCTCTSPDGEKVAVNFNHQISQKGNQQMTTEQIAAAIDQLDAAGRAKLMEKLNAAKIGDLKAATDKSRFDRLNAAAVDPKFAVAFKTALRGLARLGLELESVAAAGDVNALNKAMDENKWSPQERMQLKTILANIGALR
jgi:hypothetical protein